MIKPLAKKLLKKMPMTVQLAVERRRNVHRQDTDILALPQLVPPGTIALDVGANLGLFTLYLQPLARQVIAFEPLPDYALRLQEKYKGINIEVRNLALGKESGTLTLNTPFAGEKKLHAWSSLAVDFEGKSQRDRPITRIEKTQVPVSILDQEAPDGVGFVKIDVEGFEEEVLLGGLNFLRKQKPNLLVEIEERHTGKDIHGFFAQVEDLGYQGFYPHEGTWHDLKKFDPKLLQSPDNADGVGLYINNFAFISKDRVCPF